MEYISRRKMEVTRGPLELMGTHVFKESDKFTFAQLFHSPDSADSSDADGFFGLEQRGGTRLRKKMHEIHFILDKEFYF